jgi:hypothetical protein
MKEGREICSVTGVRYSKGAFKELNKVKLNPLADGRSKISGHMSDCKGQEIFLPLVYPSCKSTPFITHTSGGNRNVQ